MLRYAQPSTRPPATPADLVLEVDQLTRRYLGLVIRPHVLTARVFEPGVLDYLWHGGLHKRLRFAAVGEITDDGETVGDYPQTGMRNINLKHDEIVIVVGGAARGVSTSPWGYSPDATADAWPPPKRGVLSVSSHPVS